MEFSKPKEFNGSEKTIKTTCISATQTTPSILCFQALKNICMFADVLPAFYIS